MDQQEETLHCRLCLLEIFVLIFIDLMEDMQGSNGVLILDADFLFIGSCISNVFLTMCGLLDV